MDEMTLHRGCVLNRNKHCVSTSFQAQSKAWPRPGASTASLTFLNNLGTLAESKYPDFTALADMQPLRLLEVCNC